MYVCSLRTNKWSYDHRQEGAALGQKMSYIRQTAGDRGALKDIQIFGMSSWLRQVHDAVLKLFRDFQLREQRVRLLGDLAEVALTFLRNGAAYGYLLALALGEGLSVSEFLLYFTAVGNFTTWVTGILKGFGELHQFSLELSSVRSYIEAPEPFRMEGGKAIEPDTSLPYTLELRDVAAGRAELSSVSGGLWYQGQADELSAGTISGAVEAALAACPQQARMTSVSGGLTLALPEDAGFEAAFSSMSGEFRSDFPVSGDRGPSGRALYGDGRCKLEFATTSGSMVVARG